MWDGFWLVCVNGKASVAGVGDDVDGWFFLAENVQSFYKSLVAW